MVATKEKNFLIFTFEDNKAVKYDLNTGKTYGKSGKEVKSIASQLTGYYITDLIGCFPDEKYRNFLKFLNSQFVNRIQDKYGWTGRYTTGCKVKNIGTFLSKINNYRFFEQYFSAGCDSIDREFSMPIKDLPKGYLKHARLHTQQVNLLNVKTYEKFSNEFGEIERIVDKYEVLDRSSLTSLLIPNTMLTTNYTTNERELKIKTCHDWGYNKLHENFKTLIETYHYNKMNLLSYLDNISYYEGVEPLSTLVQELVDYNSMQSSMSNYKYEKYPKNFLTTHTITCRNYNRLKLDVPVEKFEERVDTDLEFKCDNYVFIYPRTPQDIKDEAVMQNNCVAGYINKVLDGVCHIMFLRDKEKPNQSLVTLEIRDYEVVQSKRAFNKEPSEEELNAIKLFNKHLNKLKKKKLQQKQKELQKEIAKTYIAPQKFVKKAI